MQQVIAETRAELSPYAPRITTIQIHPEKIGTLIGKGGETIRALSEQYEAQIDVDDEGTVLVYATNGELGDSCVEQIRMLTKDVEVGDVFTGRVVKTTTFGAFVELTKGTDGLLHISNLKPGGRAESVEDVVNRGDELTVRVVEVNKERGRIGLRLADDPEVEGKSPEELAKIGTGDGRPSGERRGRPSRNRRPPRRRGE
jgi:polyribonucleotide nucleotidyltransferase